MSLIVPCGLVSNYMERRRVRERMKETRRMGGRKRGQIAGVQREREKGQEEVQDQ